MFFSSISNFLLQSFQSRLCATFVFHFLVTPKIPDIVNLPLNKPSQAMTNSHGDQGWGVGRGVRLACSSVRLLGQQGSCIWSECCVFRARDEGLQEIWHDILAGPDHILLLFCRPLYQFYLLKTFSPAEQTHPTPCSLSDIIITIRRGTSDIWPLSAWEEGVARGKGKLAFRGALGDGRVAVITVQTLFQRRSSSAASLLLPNQVSMP